MMQEIDNCIERSDKIINDLIEYSQVINLELVPTEPKTLIASSLAHVKAPEGVVVVDKTSAKPVFMADNNGMERVFTGIIKNAYDAMPDCGRLTITCRKSFGNVVFDFEDTGVGMDEKTLTKMWTPLFTTKAKGMGLGLPICKFIVEAHGGKIQVESEQGKGTTVKITLPLQ